MIPFLHSVAKAYSSRYPDMSEFCFLFPNKRSATFFLKYLKEESGDHVVLSPATTTISDFVADLSGRVVAGRLDLLFMLYEAYCEIIGVAPDADENEAGISFDRFRGWGETVLSDFSETDRYLADADEVFKNVKDYREISSNFLTEEQKAVIEEYFGKEEREGSTKFWKNFDKEELSDAKKKFLHLWRILSPLYHCLNGKLEEKGLATSGGVYRLAWENLREKGRDAMPYKKIVAVGFNALSTAENCIFKELRDFKGYPGFDSFADFFWDLTGPVLTAGSNSASKFVKANIRMFPCPEWALPSLRLSDAEGMPKINVVSSPSNSAQVKITGNMLANLRPNITSKEITDAKVAVILPDENLLLPMLYSLPEGMGNVNLTMGYPLRLTSVVPFVSLLRKLQFNRRKVDGETAFYHRDLRLFLSHPFSYFTFGQEVVGEILNYLTTHHRVVMSLSEIRSICAGMAEALDPKGLGETPGEVVAYIDRILSSVKNSIEEKKANPKEKSLDSSHIDIYRDALRRLSDLFREYGLNFRKESVFYLTDRLLAGETVGFKGEPLTGLQVMGTLETRSVDFDYLFILSMNERIMPKRVRSRTFIPNSLRQAYGMPPANYAESIFGYYFYRMISRAKEVTLLYDARVGGGTDSGDVSRYIVQLSHLFAKGKINKQEWKFLLNGKKEVDSSVAKTPEVKEMLEAFKKEGGKKFSASSLNDYRECQVRFFYKYLMGINTDPEPSEYIDAIGVGNILHAVMEALYVPAHKRGKLLAQPVEISKEMLGKLIEDKENLRKITTKIVNRLHFRMPEEKIDTPLTGVAEMVAQRIMEQVVRVMEYDLKIAPFKIYGSEIKEVMRVKLNSGETVNFTFAIDRLDEIEFEGEKRLRIVDYKTGSLKNEAQDFEEVFHGDYKSEQIFQLFTYAWLLGKTGKADAENVMTEIYHVPKIFKGELNLPKIEKKKVKGFLEYSGAFSEGMEKMLEEIFSSPQFEAAPEERCGFCALRSICGR